MADAEALPQLQFVFAAHVKVDAPLDLGDVGKGGRRIVPIAGGEFSGPQLRGTVLPGGADWQVLRDDGVAELEARYTLRTDDAALIYLSVIMRKTRRQSLTTKCSRVKCEKLTSSSPLFPKC